MADADATAGSDVASGGYADEHRPLAGYSALTSVFGTATAAVLVAAYRSGRKPPLRWSAWDVVTVGAATHKLSRLLSKDKVTSFLRAPFVQFEEETGQGEVSEEPRGGGLRRATGELLGCPYCLGQWVATGMTLGLMVAPRFTRMVAFAFSAETLADFLQLAYLAAEERASTS